MKTKIYLLLFPLLFISCDEFIFEKELDLSHLTEDSRLVLNSIIYADSAINRVRYAHTYPIFDPEESREVLKHPSWDYYFTDDKVYYLPDVETQFFINDQAQHNIYVEDSTTYIQTTVEAGQVLKIEAQWKDRKVSAQTKMPNKPEVSALDTEQSHSVILLKDEKGVANYYRLLVFCEFESHIHPEYAEKHNLPTVMRRYSTGYITDDPILTWGNPANDDSDFDVTNFEQNYFSIFTDEAFADGEAKLRFQARKSYYGSWYFEMETDYGTVITAIPKEEIEQSIVREYATVQALSEEIYNYYSSLSAYSQMNDYVVEPIRIYNNIEGGLGVFGAINERTIVASESEWEDERDYDWWDYGSHWE